MRFSKVYAAQAYDSQVSIIDVETDLARGLHSFSIVGLPDKSIAEARDRVSAAIKNSGFESPKTKNHKIVISLAPSSIKKGGNSFDLAMAIGYLLASEDILFDPHEKIFIGELSLDGIVRPVKGILSMLYEARSQGFKEIYVPSEYTQEGSSVDGIVIYPVATLLDLVNHLVGSNEIAPHSTTRYSGKIIPGPEKDFSFIQGHEKAKRCLTIAAVGKHHCIFHGIPGTGKTLLAKAFSTILPELEDTHALEVASFYSQFGIEKESFTTIPFRNPHHTSSYSSIIGGGKKDFPGEAALAHRGILFLDEFPEFDRRVIEGLREPLENKSITIARAFGTIEYNTDFIFIGTMNPCPCGYHRSQTRKCSCTPRQIQQYQSKISGPVLDRIDLRLEILSQKISETKMIHESSQKVREKVIAARKFEEEIQNTPIEQRLSPSAKKYITYNLSSAARSYRSLEKLQKIGASIANLDHSEKISEEHLREATDFTKKIY